MKSIFDRVIDRRGTNSLKWDNMKMVFGRNDLFPLWVADMDFEAPEPVLEAIKRRAGHGIYGYTFVADTVYAAVIDWMRKRHGWIIERDWVLLTPGVVPSISVAINAFTEPGDGVIIQSPVYHPFFSTIRKNNRRLVINRLKHKNGFYLMDFEDLAAKIDKTTRLLILCSPHNPVGRVWKREELEILSEICFKNNILIVSDEIHSDIVYKGSTHIPYSSLSDATKEYSLILNAPSKTFNIPGLATSFAIIPNAALRAAFEQEMKRLNLGALNIFGLTAFEAAYKFGEEWLNSLLCYLEENIDFLLHYIATKLPPIRVYKPEGTYLVWMDFSNSGIDTRKINKLLADKTGIALSDGAGFGPGGEKYQRINIACPRGRLKEALGRIEKIFH
ncbi:MAG: PatB family C-S lyase [Spirochaetota bacterium]